MDPITNAIVVAFINGGIIGYSMAAKPTPRTLAYSSVAGLLSTTLLSRFYPLMSKLERFELIGACVGNVLLLAVAVNGYLSSKDWDKY